MKHCVLANIVPLVVTVPTLDANYIPRNTLLEPEHAETKHECEFYCKEPLTNYTRSSGIDFVNGIEIDVANIANQLQLSKLM